MLKINKEDIISIFSTYTNKYDIFVMLYYEVKRNEQYVVQYFVYLMVKEMN